MKARLIRLVVTVVLLAAGTVSVFSMPEHDTIHTYYSDGTYTTVVGHFYDMCTGRWSDGQTSQYVDIEIGYACGGGAMQTAENVYGIQYQCSDGQDNDGDGLIDCFDPGCWGGCP